MAITASRNLQFLGNCNSSRSGFRTALLGMASLPSLYRRRFLSRKTLNVGTLAMASNDLACSKTSRRIEAVFLREAREYGLGDCFAPGGTLETDLSALDAHLSTSDVVTCLGLSDRRSDHV